MNERHELYVGYRPRAPAAIARFVRRVVLVLLLMAVVLAASFAASQRRFDDGSFEFGNVRSFEGTVYEDPYPVLIDVQGGSTLQRLLVDVGKFGAGDTVDGLDGRRVTLLGTRIHGSGHEMVEIAAEPEPAAGAGAKPPASVELGPVSVRGEIVDSKCFLGVMKPGRGKPHRACAARCIAGGIPPALLVESPDGRRSLLLLVDDAGGPLGSELLPFVAEPIELTGRVRRQGRLLYLYTDLGALHRR